MAARPAHESHPTPGGSPFPPIAEYGFLSDCEVSALVAASGNVEWLCLPRMDGPGVFAAVLDRDAGWFRFGPADVDVPAGRRYLPGTMVLETTWGVPNGWAEVRDVLLMGPWRHQAARSATHRPRAIARRRLRAGEQAYCALSWGDGTPPGTYAEAHRRMGRTADFWHEWISRGDFPDHPWRKYLQRSALTLKGLIYAPTGALLAAATSSLPETPEGERNYDYRFTWLRDSTFMLWGLYTLGLDREANDFFYFLADLAASEDDLQIMYGIGGERELTESELGHLSGYDGARPVRIGNGAFDQRQHDVWGVLLDSLYLHTRSRDRLDERRWPMVTRQVEAALTHWREPDQGLWEVRGPARHFTASKIMCWVAADRGAKLAQLRDDHKLATRWRQAADERVRATVLAIADELTEDELVLRYRVEETDDGFTGEEGTFTICSFWLVSALTEIGEVARARALCEKLLSHASALLLYAEEIDSHTGRHLGNFPQAFSHLALINAVMHLIRADERAVAAAVAQSGLDPSLAAER